MKLEKAEKAKTLCYHAVCDYSARNVPTTLSLVVHFVGSGAFRVFLFHRLHFLAFGLLFAFELPAVVFRSRKKFSTTYAIVLFFFSPDLFMKISNFSKTVHTIFTKFCTVILHLKGPPRVQRHQNRMAGM